MNKLKCEACNLTVFLEESHLFKCGAKADPKDCSMQRVEATRSAQISPERGRTHGNFADNADYAIAMRDLNRSMPGWKSLTHSQQLALDEIELKKGRILSGGGDNAKFREHWVDIQGYGKLGEDSCV